MVTLSVIKADVGGFVGHSNMHLGLMKVANTKLYDARERDGNINDYKVMHCGDDLELIITHEYGEESERIHKLSWDVFTACTQRAKELKLYGAGQDLLKDAFTGNVKGLGPGVAEMDIEERTSEPIIIFMADKTSPGAWNLPLYKIFADPCNTIGLVIDEKLHDGFRFKVLDILENEHYNFNCPEDIYDMLVLIGSPGRFVISSIHKKDDMIAAKGSVQKLNLLAGKYVGKDDPVLIVRCQSGLPAVGEVLEPFAFPHAVEGWMRGSHYGPLMPVSFEDANPTRFDGPPRVIAAGFQLSNGKLLGPVDLFKDPSFDETRKYANEIADYFRRHGPFEPHRLSLDAMEYTTLPLVMEKLKQRKK